MSPKWMHSNAVITGLHALYPQYLEILPKTAAINQQVIQLPLIAPNILTSTNSKCYSDSYSTVYRTNKVTDAC